MNTPADRAIRRPATAVTLLLLARAATGGEPVVAPTSPACDAAEYRALDFWAGRWRVETPKGELAGHSRIEPALGGCVVLEHWTGLFLTTGRVQHGLGIHRYDAATRRWRQAWVDDTPATADSIGRQEGDRIVYEKPAAAGTARTRMTLRPLGDGQVEQRGERWDEAAGLWQATFHLIYVREP